jgi:hypothetical protein
VARPRTAQPSRSARPRRRFARALELVTRCSVAVFVCLLGLPATALADACHVAPPLETLGLGFHLSTSFELATYDNARGTGSYVGIALAAAYQREWLRARASLPAYRLRRNDETFHGPGDLLVATEVALLQNDEQTHAAGVGLAVSLPTGDESSDLGMGHVMLMPGIWGELTFDRTFLQTQVVYGKALGSHDEHAADEHAGHHGHAVQSTDPGPIVDPMNMSELAGRISGGFRILDFLRIRTGIDGAIPVADDQGESRGIAVLGVDFLPDPFNATIEGQMPFAGDPFTAKALFSIGFRF